MRFRDRFFAYVHHLLTLAVAAVLPTVSLAQRTANRVVPDTVRLTFRWPPVTNVRVEAHRYAEGFSEGKHDTTDVTISYRMTSQRSDSGYLIRFSDFAMPGELTGAPDDSSAAAVLNAFLPNYRVSLTGEFVGLESPELVRAVIDSLMRSRTDPSDPMPPQAQDLLRHVTSPAVLAAFAAEDWNELVGTWFDAEFEIGQVYTAESVEPYPLFPGAQVLMRFRYSALRRLACDSVAAPHARDCVELRAISAPDSAAMRALLDRMVSDLAPDKPDGIGFTSMSIVNDVRLIARPETLLPVHVVRTKRSSGSARTGAGKTETFYRLDIRSRTYRYDK